MRLLLILLPVGGDGTGARDPRVLRGQVPVPAGCAKVLVDVGKLLLERHGAGRLGRWYGRLRGGVFGVVEEVLAELTPRSLVSGDLALLGRYFALV